MLQNFIVVNMTNDKLECIDRNVKYTYFSMEDLDPILYSEFDLWCLNKMDIKGL